MTGPDTINSLINEEAAKLQALMRQRDGLDRQIEASRTRLGAFQQALTALTGNTIPLTAAPLEVGKPTIGHPDPWEDALRIMRAKGQFTTDDIFAEARSRGSDIDRAKTRSRLAHLVDRDKLNRVHEGVFAFPESS